MRLIKSAFFLTTFVGMLACSDSEPSTVECGGACSADQRCVEGKCISPQVLDMEVVDPDLGPDVGFIDAMPPQPDRGIMDAGG